MSVSTPSPNYVAEVIDFDKLVIDKRIGTGGSSEVFLAIYDNNKFALKQFRIDMCQEKLQEKFKKEVEIMKKLQHPNIVGYFGYCTLPQPCILMEYMENGSLYDLIHCGNHFAWERRLEISKNIACGLKYLHERNVIHGDLKARNILIDKDGIAKICDFGMSKIKRESRSMTPIDGYCGGTIAWLAPELHYRGMSHTKKSDIYSLGVVNWELSSQRIPFEDAPNDSMISVWIKQGQRETIPDNCPREFGQIILQCWNPLPDNRPDIEEIFQALCSPTILDVLHSGDSFGSFIYHDQYERMYSSRLQTTSTYDDHQIFLMLFRKHRVVKLVEFLEMVRNGIRQIDEKDEDGNSILHIACRCGNLDDVQTLYLSGAPVDVRNNEGMTPLHQACRFGHTETVNFLINNGAKIDCLDNYSNTPLHWACMNGNNDTATLLLKGGANIHIQNNFGNTPLHLVLIYGPISTARMLLTNGASVEICNRLKRTPIDIARDNNKMEIFAAA